VSRRPTKPPIHLRVQTENVIGGTQFISICGVRALETYQSRQRFNLSLAAVTCAACIVRARGGMAKNQTRERKTR
jgi:hypothetical protein